jgi:hypothetical protein
LILQRKPWKGIRRLILNNVHYFIFVEW